MSEKPFSEPSYMEAELVFDLSRWTSDGGPTIDLAFCRNNLEPDEIAKLDAWLDGDVDRQMKWEALMQEADAFVEKVRPLTTEALTRFRASHPRAAQSTSKQGFGNRDQRYQEPTIQLDQTAALETQIGSTRIQPYSIGGEVGYMVVSPLTELLGMAGPACRSLMVLSAFNGERSGNEIGSRPFTIPPPQGDELAVSKNPDGFRYAVPLGDLMAAQHLQRMCVDQGIKMPTYCADRMDQMAWDRPEASRGCDEIERSQRQHEYTLAFVVGLVSNANFVQLYNERLRSIFELRYVDPAQRSGLQISVGAKAPTELNYFSFEGVMKSDWKSGSADRDFSGRFILIARIKDGEHRYFVVGGNTEPLTHFAGILMRNRWQSVMEAIPNLKPTDDFVLVYRVSEVQDYNRDWPTVAPMIVWSGTCPDATRLTYGTFIDTASTIVETEAQT